MSSRQRNEDLFEDTRMSFGQHIEELRKCLMRSLYGLAFASIFGFMYADQIVKFLQRPLEVAIQQYDQQKAIQEMTDRLGYVDPEYNYWIDVEKRAPRRVLVDPEEVRISLGLASERENKKLPGLDILPDKSSEIVAGLLAASNSKDQGQLAAKAIWKELNQEEQDSIRRMSSLSLFDDEGAVEIKNILGRVATESKLYLNPVFNDLTEESTSWLSFLGGGPKPLAGIKKQLLEAETPNPVLARKLNRALIRSVFVNELTAPRAELIPLQLWDDAVVETQSLSPHEPFMIWMKAGLFAALILASPWILFQLWTFVSAGLYPHEKRYVHWYLPISILLFFAGVSLAFFFVMTPVLDFLFKFNATMGITPQLRINYWLSFVMYLPIGFGVAFQLPLVMLVLNRLGFLEISVYLSKWRIAVMIIFVLSMLLTPADPLSMILLALPLTVLYFFGIALCKWMPRNKNPFGEVYEPT